MFGVCNRYDHRPWVRNQWQCVLSHFDDPTYWCRGVPESAEIEKIPAIKVETAEELPDVPLIVLAHPEGRYIKGVQDLRDFKHPEHAIYLFGQDNLNLNIEEDLGARIPDHYVFIPSGRYEMYSFIAGSIVLYDRLVKNHG